MENSSGANAQRGRGGRRRSSGRGRGNDGSFHGGRGNNGSFPGGRGYDGSFHGGRGNDGSYHGGRGNNGSFHGGRGNTGNFHGGRGNGGGTNSPLLPEPNEARFGHSLLHPPPLAPLLGFNHPGHYQVPTYEQSNNSIMFNADYQDRHSRPEMDRQMQFSGSRGNRPHFQPEIPPPNFRGPHSANLNNNFHRPEQMGLNEAGRPTFSLPSHPVRNNARRANFNNYQSGEHSSDVNSSKSGHQQNRKARNQNSKFDGNRGRSRGGNNPSSFSSGNEGVSNERPNLTELKQTYNPEKDYHRSRATSNSRPNSFNTGNNCQTNRGRNYFEGKRDQNIWSSTSSLNSTTSLQDHKTMQTRYENDNLSRQQSHDAVTSSLSIQDETASTNQDANFQTNNAPSLRMGVSSEGHVKPNDNSKRRNKRGKNKPSHMKQNKNECKNDQFMNQNADSDVRFSSSDGSNVSTVEELENILGMEPLDIVQLLSDDDYSGTLQEELSPKMLVLVIAILCKVCSVDSSNLKGEILRKASLPAFLGQIFKFLTKLPYTDDQSLLQVIKPFYTNVLTFYKTLSEFLPSAEKMWFTHLQELKKSIKTSEKHLNLQFDCNALYMDINLLLQDMDISNKNGENTEEGKKQVKNKAVHKYFPEPIGDFRTVSLFPRPEDIYSEQPFLYPNVVIGPYRSVDQYLDTQFKLLREDFISPIRQAIRDYKRQQHTKEKKRIDNVRIYRKTKFLRPTTVTDKVGYEICFDVDNRVNRVNWEFSNRFMFGSLLLFSNDHFDTFFLATVASRNVKELEKKRVTVELRGPSPNVKSILGKEFVMAESEAYFEPYFNVLNALQRFNQINFPLARYIVDVFTETGPPKYLSQHDVYNINMGNNSFTFTALNDNEWPSNQDLGLDPSQYGAFKAALTNDIIVVQGPPGTGKTFLGLRIAQSLLNNSQVWNRTSSPILVVCFTNHALDQFLEGLLPFTSKLVRIGGKSKGKELDMYNIRERRKEQNYYKKATFNQKRTLNLQMSTVFSEMKTHQTNIQSLDDVGGILSLKTLQLVMSEYHKTCFMNDDQLLDWLLVGIGKVDNEERVNIFVTADKGVVKETSVVNDSTTEEDDRLKQAFFDTIELESVPPSDGTVVVHYACTLDGIQNKHEQMLRGRWNRHRDELGFILAHLKRELLECKQLPYSENEKRRLMNSLDVHHLPPPDRWKLYHSWVEILKNGLILELSKKDMEYKDLAFQFEQYRQGDDLQILKTSHVVGTTTTIAAKLQPLLTALAPKIGKYFIVFTLG